LLESRSVILAAHAGLRKTTGLLKQQCGRNAAARLTAAHLLRHGRLMLAVCGTGGRTRTYDLRIWNPLLYQLSYARMKD
jgi:hypothetical protein